MSIVVRFQPANLTKEKYDSTNEKLEEKVREANALLSGA